MTVIAIESNAREQMIDITDEVRRLIKGTRSGVVWLHRRREVLARVTAV